MKFLIRDDDPCGYTDPKELISCYDDIWDTVPVNFSVTPFRIPAYDKNVPKYLFGSDGVLPLGENVELVELLKELYKKGKVDFAMHGYNHIKYDGIPEYVAGKNLPDKTREGKLYLEKILDCKINTFVPPHNSIARSGFDAVVENNMNLVSVPSFIRSNYRALQLSNVPKYIKQKYFNYVHRVNYPYVLDFSDHKEVNYVPVTPSQTMENIKRIFYKNYDLDAVFVFAVHYHAFDKKLLSGELIRDALSEIINIAESLPGIEYVTYKNLWG